MKITGSNVTIMVKDMDRSIEFYKTIGLTLKQRWDNNYAMVETGGLVLGIHPAGDGETGSGALSIGFFVEKITEAKDLLTKNKIEFKAHDDGQSGAYVHFKDPDGTILYFVQPRW